jgi:hypothetical protein
VKDRCCAALRQPEVVASAQREAATSKVSVPERNGRIRRRCLIGGAEMLMTNLEKMDRLGGTNWDLIEGTIGQRGVVRMKI